MNRYLAQEKRVFDISKFTVVGSPTITEDGILSNCSSTDYVNTQVQLSQLAGKSWTVKGSITAGNEISVAVKFSSTGFVTIGSITWYYSTRRIAFVCRTGVTGDVNNEGIKISTANNSFEVGDKIYYTLSFDITTGTYSFYADKVNGTILVGTWTATTDNKELYYINTQPTQYISFGRGSEGNANLTTGSVDMKDFSVEVEGETVFTGTKPVHLLERRKGGFDLSKFTVVGTPTITEDGVASGFSSSNQIKPNWTFNQLNKFEINGEFTFSNDISTNQIALGMIKSDGTSSQIGMELRVISENSLYLLYSSTSGHGSIIFNQTNFPRVVGQSNKYKIVCDGTNISITINGVTKSATNYLPFTPTTFFIGAPRQGSGAVFFGSIDLPSISITIDGKEVFTGAKENYYVLRG